MEKIVPDQATIANIRIMVERSLSFFKAFGPVTADGFTMEGSYTATITTGDGDFLTKDTLWDFKVTTSKPNKDHTLQLLIYYLMGRRSIHPEFQTTLNHDTNISNSSLIWHNPLHWTISQRTSTKGTIKTCQLTSLSNRQIV